VLTSITFYSRRFGNGRATNFFAAADQPELPLRGKAGDEQLSR